MTPEPIRAGDRLRVRSGDRRTTLALERRDEVLATIVLRRQEIEVVAGERSRVVSAFALGSALIVHEGETYELRLPKRGPGALRRGATIVAGLEMRHPDHGSVLLIDVADEVPAPELFFGYAGTMAYGRGLAGRRKKRSSSPSWGKESALADVVTLTYLDFRTGGDVFSGADGGGGGGGDGGGGGGGGD